MFEDPWKKDVSFSDDIHQHKDETRNSDFITFMTTSLSDVFYFADLQRDWLFKTIDLLQTNNTIQQAVIREILESCYSVPLYYVHGFTIAETGKISSALELSSTDASSINEIERQPVNQLMLVSLLEHICSRYCDTQEESQILFQVLCEKLSSMKLIPNLQHLDEFKAIRSKYQESLSALMLSSLKAVKKYHVTSTDPEKLALQLQLPGLNDQLINNREAQMNFRNMFDWVQNIGRGGFGTVMKAKNKLDKRYYAVKRIPFAMKDTNKCLKTLREVRVLSNLYHKNIVRYHASWIEYDFIEKYQKVSKHSENSASVIQEESMENSEEQQKDSLNECLIGNFNGIQGGAGNRSMYHRSVSLNSYQQKKDRINQLNRCFMNTNRRFGNRYTTANGFSMAIFIQMEICDMTLRKWLDERNHAANQDVDWFINRDIMQQMCEGLQYIHDNQLLHRDIKPDNIFINKIEGDKLVVKIGDFGLARSDMQITPTEIDMRSFDIVPFSDQTSNFESFPDEQSHTMGVGTATYAAPEQQTTNEYTNKIDIYSAGIITFELFQKFSTSMERLAMIKHLLDGNIDETIKTRWPEECSMILQMTSVHPNLRPSAKQLLDNPIFSQEKQVNEKYRVEIEKRDNEIERLKVLLAQAVNTVCEECKKNCYHYRK